MLILTILMLAPPLPSTLPYPPTGTSTLAEKLVLLPRRSAGVGDTGRLSDSVEVLAAFVWYGDGIESVRDMSSEESLLGLPPCAANVAAAAAAAAAAMVF